MSLYGTERTPRHVCYESCLGLNGLGADIGESPPLTQGAAPTQRFLRFVQLKH
jgi:hypothetical protein